MDDTEQIDTIKMLGKEGSYDALRKFASTLTSRARELELKERCYEIGTGQAAEILHSMIESFVHAAVRTGVNQEYNRRAVQHLNVTIDGKAAKDVGLFTGEELQAAVRAAEDRATDNARQLLYTVSEVRQAIQQALSPKTDKGMVSAVIEDVGAELQQLKKGTER